MQFNLSDEDIKKLGLLDGVFPQYASQPSEGGENITGGASGINLTSGLAASAYAPLSTESGDPSTHVTPDSFFRIGILGHDNSELADRQWSDFIMKEAAPGLLTGIKHASSLFGAAGIPMRFLAELEKNMLHNYDNPQYTFGHGIRDTLSTEGIEIGSDLSAKRIADTLSKLYPMPEIARIGLEKGLSYILNSGAEAAKESLRAIKE